MAKSKSQKAELLASYKEMLKNSGGFIAVSTDKLDNITTVKLKKKLAETDSTFTVIKNTIFKLALQDTDIDPNALTFTGATAIVTYTDDPTTPAKAIKEILDEQELLEPRFAYVEKQVLDKNAVIQLAEIPSREELLAKLLGSISSPLTGFMNAVTGNIRGFTQILSQLKK